MILAERSIDLDSSQRRPCYVIMGMVKKRRLNNITVRRRHKVTVHCFLPLIVVQAQALHSATSNQVLSIRQCVHAVA